MTHVLGLTVHDDRVHVTCSCGFDEALDDATPAEAMGAEIRHKIGAALVDAGAAMQQSADAEEEQ